MIQGKFEIDVNWTKNMIPLITSMTELMKKLSGDVDQYEARKFKEIKTAVSMFTSFFVAQRSLFYFQFADAFDWAKQMIPTLKELAQLQIDDMSLPTGLFKGMPPNEVLENILDAIGNITGKTLFGIRKHLMEDVRTEFYDNETGDWTYGTLLAKLAADMRLKPCQVEAAKEDGHPEAKMIWEFFELYGKFHKNVKGFSAAGLVDQLELALDMKGMDFMHLLPSPDDLLSTETFDNNDSWVKQYACSFMGDDSCGSPDEAFMEQLKGECVELAAIVHAAWPLLKCIDMDMIDSNSGGMGSKAEAEARKFFEVVDSD
jgi:hypothetical protein